jgi:hypothetical protein
MRLMTKGNREVTRRHGVVQMWEGNDHGIVRIAEMGEHDVVWIPMFRGAAR